MKRKVNDNYTTGDEVVRDSVPVDIKYNERISVVIFVATIVLFIYYSSTNFLNTFSVDDDKLFYGITALRILYSGAAGELAEMVSSCVVVSKEDIFAERSELRSGYIWNYVALSGLWGGLWHLLGATADSETVVSGSSFMFSFYVTQILALGAAASVVVSFSPGRHQRIFGFTSSVICCALLSVYGEPDNWLTRSDAWLTIKHVLSAPDHFNLFNFAPRGISTLVLLAIATLRWTGHIRSFYAGVLVLCFVHQSNATMVFCVFIAVDLLLRRQMFRDPVLAVFASCTAVIIFLREELLGVAGWPSILMAVTILVLLAAFSPVAQNVLQLAFRSFRLGARWSAKDVTPGIDVALLAIGWTCSLPLIAAAINGGMVDEASGRYLFWQLHSRLGSLLLPTLIAGTTMALYPYGLRMQASLKWLPVLGLGVAAFGSNATPVSALPELIGNIAGRSTSQMHAVHGEAEALWGRQHVILDYTNERPHYYSLIAPLLGVEIANFPREECL